MAALEESATTSARPPSGSRTLVLVIGGPIGRAEIPRLCERVRALLQGSNADLVCDVAEVIEPDADTLDALARMQLTARRLGCQIRLFRASCELQELLAYAGLGDVVPVCAALPLRPSGQTEEREETLCVEEEVQTRDPSR